jgi:hypothetical protein
VKIFLGSSPGEDVGIIFSVIFSDTYLIIRPMIRFRAMKIDIKYKHISNFAAVTLRALSEAWVLAGWLLGSWVRIPLKAWMFIRVFLCCVVLCR